MFLDLKLHDIPTTVQRASAQVARMGATFLTVHAYPQTMKAARAGVAGSGLNTYYNPSNYYTYYYGTQVATGINAASNGEGAQIAISSSGDSITSAAATLWPLWE